ncbi:MAG: carbohydrate binding domain-containing protein, partial [Candidatus Omnitrophota bacterium]
MKTLFIILFFCAGIAITPAPSQAQGLLLDDFEGEISSGPGGTVNSSAGGGSSVEVAASPAIKYSGKQALKITYKAVPLAPSYIVVIRNSHAGSSTNWLAEPEGIIWQDYNAIAFYTYGSDSKTRIAFDIIDSGFEVWRFIFEDNFIGWKQVICPFNEFQPRSDWQPDNADKNHTLDFPIKEFRIDPLIKPPPGGNIKDGTFYFDKVELIASGTAQGRAQNLLLDDFEGEISSGPGGTVNSIAGGGSSVEVAASPDIKYSGKQALKVTYKATPPVYSHIWVNWLAGPEEITWQDYNAIAFYMYGSDSKTRIAFDIIDSGFEVWRFIFEDNFIGWK